MQGIRAQAFTLEGLLAALIVLAGLVFALQAVVVTPSGGGTASAPADVERVGSFLRETAENGSLKRAVLAWSNNSQNGGFYGSGDGRHHFVREYPNNSFGAALNESFSSSVVVNVVVHPSGDADSQRLIYNGIPGGGSVRSTTTVAIYDGDYLRYENGTRRGPTVGEVESQPNRRLYDVDDQFESDLYRVLKVEVIVWQP